MTDTITELEQEARRLLDSPREHIGRLREIQTQKVKLNLQEYEMTDDFLSTLDAEELDAFRQGVEDAKQKVQTSREAKQQAALEVEYRREMLAARGQGHKLTQIREKYARRGLNVGTVDFS